MIPLDNAQIEAIRTEKRNLEVEVANALNQFFKKHYKYAMQRIVRQLVTHILSIEPGKLDRALAPKAGEFLLFTKGVKPSWQGMSEFLAREMFWTLEQCSDVIRVFGELNEEWKTLGTTGAHVSEQLKLRPFPPFLKPTHTQKDFEKERKKDPRYNQWGMHFGHRDRGTLPSDQWGQRGAPYVPIGPIVRGVDKFEFEAQSVISHIDHTFGLEEKGGDVSGTTTDSIYAMRWAAGLAGVSDEALKALQILPLVTMVPQGHHTIVECAYALTRHGYINYCIGYYATLAPDGAAGLEGVLAPFDKVDENKHVLVWGRGSRQQGLQMEFDYEIKAFKQAARVRSAYGFCVAGPLDAATAMNVLQAQCPALWADARVLAAQM